jgi:nitroreductase
VVGRQAGHKAGVRLKEETMDALEAVLSRRTVPVGFLGEPAPEGEVLARILAAGASAPDHGRLRPWRFIVVRGTARDRLGEVFAAALARRDASAPEAALEQERQRPLRAPLVVAVAAKVVPDHPKIPTIEQILAAGAAAQNVLIAAHGLGFGAKWSTGANAYDEHVKAALGLAPDDRVVGFLYLGSIEGTPPAVPHADARDHTVEWHGPA